jgi:hypothetical protein
MNKTIDWLFLIFSSKQNDATNNSSNLLKLLINKLRLLIPNVLSYLRSLINTIATINCVAIIVMEELLIKAKLLSQPLIRMVIAMLPMEMNGIVKSRNNYV